MLVYHIHLRTMLNQIVQTKILHFRKKILWQILTRDNSAYSIQENFLRNLHIANIWTLLIIA